MSNNQFFKSFFNSNNAIWNEIQNNPFVHRDLWGNYIPTKVRYHLVRNNRQPYTGAIDANIQYHPGVLPAVATKRTRVPGNMLNWSTDLPYNVPRRLPEWEQKYKILKMHQQYIPAANVVLPDGNLNRNNAVQNVNAMLGIGRFEIKMPGKVWDHTTHPTYFRNDDYWIPVYEGNWEDIPERVSRKQPHSIDKDMKFLGTKPFFTSKQKEGLVWMYSNFSDRPR